MVPRSIAVSLSAGKKMVQYRLRGDRIADSEVSKFYTSAPSPSAELTTEQRKIITEILAIDGVLGVTALATYVCVTYREALSHSGYELEKHEPTMRALGIIKTVSRITVVQFPHRNTPKRR